VNLSGRGDKDIGTVADLSGADFYDRPSMRGHTVKGSAIAADFDASGAKGAGTQA
jgi:tryptophan synthase beta chain